MMKPFSLQKALMVRQEPHPPMHCAFETVPERLQSNLTQPQKNYEI